ncbi:MAG: hypothetical protein MPJ24_11555 [Pirellulaceae bacterium]|nr:hypothetical protein [Pirellulaceae bacterium]
MGLTFPKFGLEFLLIRILITIGQETSKWDEKNLCLYTNFGGHPIDDTGFNPPNVKIDVAKMEVTSLKDDTSRPTQKYKRQILYNSDIALHYYGYIQVEYHSNAFSIFLENKGNRFVRIDRPDWPESKSGTATAKIYRIGQSDNDYQTEITLTLPYKALPFQYILSGNYFLVIGDGDDPRALSIYNIKTGEEKHLALEDFLPEEMIAEMLPKDGSRHPKIRTRYFYGFHSRHRWAGSALLEKNKDGDICVYTNGTFGYYTPPNVEINLKKMTVTLLGYNEEESEK